MLSVSFFILLSTTLFSIIGFLITPKENRWIVLLLASLIFYFLLFSYQIIIVIIFSFIVFIGAHQIEKVKLRSRDAKNTTSIYVALCLIPLVISKLIPEFPEISNYLYPKVIIEYEPNQTQSISLLCISYFTFNGISYLIDVRKNYVKFEHNYFVLLLYIVFFPIVLAGPMHRADNLLSQFKNKLCLTNKNFSLGFRLFLWGMFKNFVIGQNCLIFTNTISESNATGLYILIQGFSFFLYLYFTFSSYIDIFSGIARIFNVELDRNFGNRPYAATSRKQFWEQWHISLNQWFRDYFLFSIAKKVRSNWGLNLAILATFALIGLWHGLSYKFFVWGLVNGIWIIAEKLFAPFFSFITPSIRKHVGLIYHWILASMVALLFSAKFPLNSYAALLKPTSIDLQKQSWLIQHALPLALLIISFDMISRKMKNMSFDVYLESLSFGTRWTIYFTLALGISIFTHYWTINNYYFKF